jgi:GNAT superfamily N-acetyltransferase
MDALPPGCYGADHMTDLSITILPETADDEIPIERLHERTFGPGRYARTAFRIREGVSHLLELSFTARIGTLLVGSVRLSPVRVGEAKAMLLGPLTVEPPFRGRGIAKALIARALDEAKKKGETLVVLVGDRLQAHPERPRQHAGAGRSGALARGRTVRWRVRDCQRRDHAGLGLRCLAVPTSLS